ncbi:MAG TPA: HEAT repeat domain-containing protein [Nitrospira sp.]|nr:HEAT repeat domain-containing protein [Nitrospira sp.]
MMSLLTSSDLVIQLSIWTGVAALATAVPVLLAVMVLQCLAQRRRRRSQRFRAVWHPLLIQSLIEVPTDLPPLRQDDVRLFLDFWVYLHETIRGDATASLDEVLRLVGADGAALRMLHSSRLADRLVAVVALGHLRERSVRDEFQRLIHSPIPELSLAAARALVQIDAQAAMKDLVPLLVTRTDWSLVKVAGVLSEAGSDTAAPVLDQALAGASREAAERLIRCLEATGSPISLPRVRQMMGRDETDGQLLIACLRYVGRCGGPTELSAVRARLTHSHWPVRLHAVLTLGKIGVAEDVPLLVSRLTDDEWWVRYRAAEALAGLPCVALPQLQQMQTAHPDPFVRDLLLPFTLSRWS